MQSGVITPPFITKYLLTLLLRFIANEFLLITLNMTTVYKIKVFKEMLRFESLVFPDQLVNQG